MFTARENVFICARIFGLILFRKRARRLRQARVVVA